MKPIASLTLNEAQEMKAKAIVRAKGLEIVKMVLYLLTLDATTDGQRYELANRKQKKEMEPVDPSYRGRPLPGSGLMLKGTLRNDSHYTLVVCYAYNDSERVFYYEKDHGTEAYHVFREGSWVSVLKGNYDAVRYKEENADLVSISRNFTPVEVPHQPESDE